jgi:hypothetical protein
MRVRLDAVDMLQTTPSMNAMRFGLGRGDHEQSNRPKSSNCCFITVCPIPSDWVIFVVRRNERKRNAMEHPAHLRYTLTRWQRLIPHLRLWHAIGPLIVASFVTLVAAAFRQNAWFFLAAFIVGWFGRGYVLGLVDVMLNRTREMDIIIEPLGIGFLIGTERWYVHMDGVLSISQLTNGVWTIAHHNGTVINIPSHCMPETCLTHIHAAIKDKWAYLQPFADEHRKRLNARSRENPTT